MCVLCCMPYFTNYIWKRALLLLWYFYTHTVQIVLAVNNMIHALFAILFVTVMLNGLALYIRPGTLLIRSTEQFRQAYVQYWKAIHASVGGHKHHQNNNVTFSLWFQIWCVFHSPKEMLRLISRWGPPWQ